MITRSEKWTHMHVIFWCQNKEHKKYHLRSSFELIFNDFCICSFSSEISRFEYPLRESTSTCWSHSLAAPSWVEKKRKRKRDIVLTYSERSSTEIYHDSNEVTFNPAKISSVYGCPPFCTITELTTERSFPTCSVLVAASLVLLAPSVSIDKPIKHF